MAIHLGEIGLTSLAGPTGAPGNVNTAGSPVAGEVAFFTNATTITGDTTFTFSSITKILAATEVDIGATPFKFLETAGVLQLGNANVRYLSADGSLRLGATSFLWVTEDTGGIVFEDVGNPGSASQTVTQDLADSMIRIRATTGTVNGLAARVFDGGGNNFSELQLGAMTAFGGLGVGLVTGASAGGGNTFGVGIFPAAADSSNLLSIVCGTRSVLLNDSAVTGADGSFYPSTDNTQDLGTLVSGGPFRWKMGYFGAGVQTPVISPAAGVNFTLPATNAAGVLTNDGAGNLSWV